MCIGSVETGLQIAESSETGAIYLYGRVNEESETEFDYFHKSKLVKTIFDDADKKHYLLRVANNIDSFVKDFTTSLAR